jgi:hypothetical protein
MESLKNWEPWVDRSAKSQSFGALSLSKDRSHEGQTSILLTSPTRGEEPNFASSHGRPWGSASAIYRVDNEDWSRWNRITLWVYPDLPGFRTVSFNLVLHNDTRADNSSVCMEQWDDAFVPYDSRGGYLYFNIHSGLNYQLLENQKWNKVFWEIPHVQRDKVVALELRYRLQGNERGATDTVKYYFDELYLEKVAQPEHYEGWNVAPGQIAHNHVGYPTGFPKTALASGLSANRFALIHVETKKAVLEKPIAVKRTHQGTFQVLDFSEIDRPGTYALKAGDVQTRPFRIDNFSNLYRGTLVKLINFFYCQRCGTEVPGVHSACHRDVLCAHGEKRVVINGGWHDAGDLSQSTAHTAEAAHQFFALAERFQDTDPELSARLLEEAKWGLDWLLKTRFGDGERVNWAVMDFWTDGILGTADDVVVNPDRVVGSPTPVKRDAYINFQGARAEAKAAMVLSKTDAILADYALRCAQEDWNFATEFIQKMNVRLAGIALNASLALHQATKEGKYREAAISHGDYILRCQQQDPLSEDVSLKGFFFEDATRKTLPFLRSITSDENHPVTGLVGLSQSFPDDDHAARWESAIRLYGAYLKEIAGYTEPYGMLPAGLYDLSQAKDRIEQAKVKSGIRLSDRYYLRRFPVWTSDRGNTSILLTKAIAAAAIARHLNDQDLLHIAYRQMEFLLGLNPFNQSIIWGEGYRCQALYTPLSGNIVGAVPCGIHTKFNRDVPYWPSDNWHNPKETWSHSSSDWLWLMSNYVN